MTKENRPVITSMSNIDWINLACSLISVLGNAVVLLKFLKSKYLRLNLFYRFVFCISGLHELYALTFTLHYTLLLTLTIELKNKCLIISGISCICFGATSVQIAVVAVDRFQASFPLSTTILQRRRVLLGYITCCIDICIIVFYVTVGIVYGKREATDCLQDVKIFGNMSFSVTVAEGLWTLCCVFFVEIPLCLATIYRIKQAVVRVRPVSNNHMISIIIPTRSFQKKTDRKLKACRTICYLVLIHTATHMSLLTLLVVLIYKPEEYKTVYQLSWTVTLVQSILDPVLILRMLPSILQML